MAAEGRWIPEGDLTEQTAGKLAEGLWWILVIARRLGIDIDEAYTVTTDLKGSNIGDPRRHDASARRK